MTAKPIVPRALANRDIDDALAYFLSENTEQAAFGFIDALEQAYTHIGRHPATGFATLRSRIKPARPALLAAGTLSTSRILSRASTTH